jgi:hypothetical protein
MWPDIPFDRTPGIAAVMWYPFALNAIARHGRPNASIDRENK